MANKEKRLRKILLNSRMKGQLKSVKTLDEAIIIIVRDPHRPDKIGFFNKLGYQTELDRGETFPEENVYFTVPSNPRNINGVIKSIITKERGPVVSPK